MIIVEEIHILLHSGESLKGKLSLTADNFIWYVKVFFMAAIDKLLTIAFLIIMSVSQSGLQL